ncbi:MAG: T9SS type A sorting domain-containing protein [Candidatus Kapabacteria bacterium]|nr:T9SS type A sorting domain-containing protein [Candidatus Kapabacteria bacterium]
MRTIFSTLVIFLILLTNAISSNLEVGAGKLYTTIPQALNVVQPGDTVVVYSGTYSGGIFKENLKGTADKWIVLKTAPGEEVIINGGSNAMQLSSFAYLLIDGFTIQGQTANGLNLDDGGTLVTPSHHLILQNCTFLGLNATGNNDQLKMSGIDTFTVTKCKFFNGSPGGSSIDMVGCHVGNFVENYFENAGSNCIQNKGGTSNIFIQRNYMNRGGERALNIGGSTGLQFFRPPGALYEAKQIYVHSNVFVGSTGPISFVGAVDCEVVNNTIINPTRWAIRILQENNEPGFVQCSNNKFINNIVYFTPTGQPVINIGGNTLPETFQFSHNLWYNPENAQWTPNTPVNEPGRIIANPLFLDSMGRIGMESPAAYAGFLVNLPNMDFTGNTFWKIEHPIGAFQPPHHLSVKEERELGLCYPNPTNAALTIESLHLQDEYVEIISITGEKVYSVNVKSGSTISVNHLSNGVYTIRNKEGKLLSRFVKY